MAKRTFKIFILFMIFFTIFHILRTLYGLFDKENRTFQVLTDKEMKNVANLSLPCSNATILSSYAMGLGNLMFIYASLFGIAKKNKKNSIIPSYFNFPLFHIFTLSSYELDVNYDSWERLTESHCCRYESKVESLPCDKNFLITGYRQSYKYFSDYFDEIRNEFKFVGEPKEICHQEIKRISDSNNCSIANKRCIFVGLHVRRGNFLNAEQIDYGFLSADIDYIERSMKFVENRFSLNSNLKNLSIYFLIFGNDYDWNIENIISNQTTMKRNLIFFSNFSPVVDMCLLSLCNHTIISTGTFGWWSAFLANGSNVYMKDQCRPDSPLCNQLTLSDYALPQWIPL